MGIEFAPDDRARLLEPYVDKVLDAIGIDVLYLSDQSAICDFGLDEEEIARISAALGIPVDRCDYIVDLAERLKGLS